MADDPSAKDDPTKDPKKDDDTLGAAGKRALERERQARRDAEARLKELEPLAAKVKELEEGKKTAEQKLIETADRLEKKIAESDRRALIAEVAQEKKLTPAQARRLQGTTKAELEDDADDLVASFTPAKTDDGKGDDKKDDAKTAGGDKNDTERKGDRGDPGRRPKEKLRSGAVTDTGDDDDDDFDPEKVADAVRTSF